MAPSTVKMAGLLDKITSRADPLAVPILNLERAQAFARLLETATNREDIVELRIRVGAELLNGGATRAAIDKFTEIEKLYRADSRVFGTKWWADIRHMHALAWLRLGEQENCLEQHNADSCILPISSEGVHRKQAGSRKAIEILEEQLQLVPRDRKGAWLLNLAYMTVGEYPDKVPQGWRITPQAFRSDYDIKQFEDVAMNLGLDVNDYAGGTVTEDFDADGDLDILMTDWSLRGPMHYFVNNGDGTFVDRTTQSGLSALFGGLNMVQADYNNDGLVDVLVLRGAWLGTEGRYPDSLLRNDGRGHFTDVTEEAGLLAFYPNQTAVWLDYNGDGWLDIYFGYESGSGNNYPCQLYRNNRDGTFTECGAAAGVDVVGFVKAVVSADYNNDGRPDLYLSRLGLPNILLRNDGPAGTNSASAAWKFSDVTAEAGVEGPMFSFPAFFFDYDNDGWQDLFVSGYRIKDVGELLADYIGAPHKGEMPKLYRNNRDGTFADVTVAARLNHLFITMGANFGDLDNDGWLDFYLGTGDPDLANLMPNRALRNAGGKFFQDVTTSGGFGHLQKGHGISFADLDHDGDQDIYHSVGGALEGDFYRNVLFENPGHGNRWIALKLEGVQSNRSALGARIKVLIETAEGERAIHRTVTSGGSFGCNPLRQGIGLGQATAIKRVEICWPATGKTNVLDGVEMDGSYSIREGDSKAHALNLRPFKFSRTPLPHHHIHSGG